MLPTDKEKARQKAYAEQFKSDGYSRGVAPRSNVRPAPSKETQGETPQFKNPSYGLDPNDPNSYLSTVPSDPSLATPIASGEFIDPSLPSGASVARAASIAGEEGYWGDRGPKGYMEDNAEEIQNEESLIDKGKKMMARIFDYQDESDLELFGMNLSAVESVFDGFVKQLIGIEDAKNLGLAALVSAAPGGVQTYSFDDLSDGNSFGDIISGNSGEINAPSTGQTIIASVAIEAKRIREGKGRLSDVLLMNPATAPFILAALKAESSPLQQNGFNILDSEQREEAFSEGWEKWMSGATDAGMVFADPLIGAGVVTKIARVGMLGNPLGVKAGQDIAVVNTEALKRFEKAGIDTGETRMNELINAADTGIDPITGENKVGSRTLDDILDEPDAKYDGNDNLVFGNVREPNPVMQGDLPFKAEGPTDQFLWDIFRQDENGNRAMTAQMLSEDPNIKGNANVPMVVDGLMRSKSFAEGALVLNAMMGTAGAVKKLDKIAPATALHMKVYRRQIATNRQMMEPQKVVEARDSFARQRDNVYNQFAAATESLDMLRETGPKVTAAGPKATNAEGVAIGKDGVETTAGADSRKLRTHEAMINKQTELVKTLEADFNELFDIWEMLDGNTPDPLYWKKDPAKAQRLFNDLVNEPDVITAEMVQAIRDSGRYQRMGLPTKNNAYSRTVVKSRERRRNAAYSYANEGTDILPRKVKQLDDSGEVVNKRNWLPSKGGHESIYFETPGAFARNARVWRWLGAENPAGYISLVGTGTVNVEREFKAATDIEFFKGNGTKVTVDKLENGNKVIRQEKKPGDNKFTDVYGPDDKPVYAQVEITVGGVARREQLYDTFFTSLSDPSKDTAMAILNVEQEIMSDMLRFNKIDFNEIELNKIMKIVNEQRRGSMTETADRGYFVDAEYISPDGKPPAMQTVAYLKSQMQNGMYMLNFEEFQKAINLTTSGGATRQSLLASNLLDKAGDMYKLFNTLWRPATLMRLSYTQRNVFEGMIRAMAYQGSLAPMLWPVKATYMGVKTKTNKRKAKKYSKKGVSYLNRNEYNGLLVAKKQADDNFDLLNTAVRIDAPDSPGNSLYKVSNSGDIKKPNELTEERYLEDLENARLAQDEAKYAVDGAKEGWLASIDKTKFGTWRKNNLEDANKNIQTLEDRYNDTYTGNLDNLDDIAPTLIRMNANIEFLRRQRNALDNDPAAAVALWTSQAGRQRRIGSGKSLGPNGQMFNDAFTGPLADINGALVSADNTVINQLSLEADTTTSVFGNKYAEYNKPILYSAKDRDAYADSIVSTIEQGSSNWIVRSLVLNDFDVNKVIREMESTDGGRDFLVTQLGFSEVGSLKKFDEQTMNGTDVFFPKVVQDANGKPIVSRPIPKGETLSPANRGNPKAFGSAKNDGTVLIDNLEQALLFTEHISDTIRSQMQRQPGFMDLLRQRVLDKEGSNLQFENLALASPDLNRQQVLNVIDTIDNPEKALGYSIGDEIIQGSGQKISDSYRSFVKTMFKILGSIPEDYVTRGPFYNARFKTVRNDMIETYLRTEGIIPDGKKMAKIKTKAGRDQGGTISNPEFNIPSKELGRIETMAHRVSLKDTREWMYTIERRTNLGKYGEWIWPFISAQQNSLTVIGKLLYKEPWVAPMIADVWKFPDRLGIEDEEGNITIPMPTDWLPDFMSDPDTPFLGGIMDEFDTITIPKDGLNVMMPESGFGVFPRPAPFVQVAASELMKWGAFPVETPQVFRSMLGDKDGDNYYALLKDYIFGEEQGASQEFASWNKTVPAYLQKVLYSKDELSAQYGYQYKTHWNTQTMRYRGNLRDTKPTVEEINKRTTNSFWFQAFGNFGLPTPYTPMPVLTRPAIQSSLKPLTDYYRELQTADPQNANYNMDRMFGDWALDASLTKVTSSVGGALSSPTVNSDIDTLDPLIRDATGVINENNLNVLGILVNNRRAADDFESSSYNVLKSKIIAGTNRKWSEVNSPAEALAETQRIAGWAIYRKAMDQLDARLYSAGLSSYEVKAAASFKAAKKQMTDNLLANPDYAGWRLDYEDSGGARISSAVRVMELAVKDQGFRDLMTGSGKIQLLATMENYVVARDAMRQMVENTGESINADSNIELKTAWDAARVKFRLSDERWSEIDALYLTGDDNLAAVAGSNIGGM